MCLRYKTDRIDGNVRQQTRLFHPFRIQTCFEPSTLVDARSSSSHWCLYCMRYTFRETERERAPRWTNQKCFGVRTCFIRAHTHIHNTHTLAHSENIKKFRLVFFIVLCRQTHLIRLLSDCELFSRHTNGSFLVCVLIVLFIWKCAVIRI